MKIVHYSNAQCCCCRCCTYDAKRSVFMSYFHMDETSIKTHPFRNFSLAFCQYLRKEIHYDPIPINLSSIKAASADEWRKGGHVSSGKRGSIKTHCFVFEKNSNISCPGLNFSFAPVSVSFGFCKQLALFALRHHRFNDHHQNQNQNRIKWNNQFRFNVAIVYQSIIISLQLWYTFYQISDMPYTAPTFLESGVF